MVHWRSEGLVQDSDEDEAFALDDTASVSNSSPLNDVSQASPLDRHAVGNRAEHPDLDGHHASPAPRSVSPTTSCHSHYTDCDDGNVPILQSPDHYRTSSPPAPSSAGLEANARDQFMLHINPETSQISIHDEPVVRTPLPEALSSPLSEPVDSIATPDFFESRTWHTASLQPSTDLTQGEQDDDADLGGMRYQAAQAGPTPSDVPAQGEAHGSFLDLDRVDDTDSRRFRKRTALQEHPYTLEGLLYRQSFRSRGLPYQRLQDTGPAQDETQDYVTRADEDLSASQQSSSQLQGASSPRAASSRQGSPPTPLSDEDAIPDFSALLRPRPLGHVKIGNKKRRVEFQRVTSSETPSGDPIDRLQRATAVIVPRSGLRIPPAHRHLPDVPQHANRTQSASIQYSSPHSLELSPELDPCQTTIIDDDGDTDHALGLQPSRGRIDLTKGTQSSPELAPRHDALLRRVERRMRGVLPASWLKLDMSSKTNSKSTQRNEHQNDRLLEKTQQRGVARPVVRPHGFENREYAIEGPTHVQSVDSADDSEGSESTKRSDAPRSPSLELLSTTFADHDPGPGFEDNFIDPMASSIRRARPQHTTARKRKRQSRLTDSFVLPNKIPKELEVSRSRHSVEGKSSERPSRQASSRKRQTRGRPAMEATRRFPPRLSILDASETSATLPEFVRVAKRQARRRPDKGRHSPRAKYISLQSKQDGLEVDNVLREWQQGWLAKSNRPVSAERMMRPSSVKEREVDASHSSVTKTTLRREVLESRDISEASTRPRVSQSRLSRAFESDAQILGSPRRQSATETAEPNARRIKRPKQTSGLPFPKRQGQLEDLEAEVDSAHHRSAFHKKLMRLNKMQQLNTVGSLTVHPDARAQRPGLLQPSSNVAHTEHDETSICQEHSRPRRSRKKRKPKRMDLGQIEVHEPAQDTTMKESGPPVAGTVAHAAPSVEILGLVPYGSTYTTDFGVGPLQVGVSFRPSTFIGSHGLESALSLDKRDLDCSSGGVSIYVGGQHRLLDSWTESAVVDVKALCQEILNAVEVRSVLDAVPSHMGKEASSASKASLAQHMRYIIDYVSRGLSFLDPIDRRSCLITLTTLSSRLFDAFNTGLRRRDAVAYDDLLRGLYLLVLLQVQIAHLSQHPAVDDATRTKCQSLLQQTVVKLNHEVISSQDRLQSFYDLSNMRLVREYGIKENAVIVEAVLVAFHGLRWLGMPSLSFWSLLGDCLSESIIPSTNDVRPLEKIWHLVFMTVPLLELDITGVLRPGSRHDLQNVTTEDCHVVKQVLARTFELYSKQLHAPTINAYVRTALARSHRLVKLWSWRKCEPILNCVFDFFARNGLHLLRNETSAGSCQFLESLDGPDFQSQLQQSDSSFDIFLKLMANGLTQLRHVYPAKKIKNIIWRFVPNHGRMHSNDEDLKREDLDALSNHHNLLVVLYYASPPGFRPSLSTLRNLVDFKSSHAEVCKLNVRAWANLARFQTSIDELLTTTDPFREWLNEIVDGCLSQHRSARAEADIFMQSHGQIISETRVEETIIANQQSIESVLQTLLSTLRAIMVGAKSPEAARSLFEQSFVSHIFTVFDVERSSASHTVVEVLSVYEAYFLLCERSHDSGMSQNTSEDSQDYGEWPSDEELDSETPRKALPAQAEHIADDLQAWLSNAFGAESTPDERLLLRTVNVMCRAIACLVHAKIRDWSFYLDPYSRGSWQQLRDTEQTRKYGPKFLASILESDPGSFTNHRTTFLTGWLSGLVERESMLKFQHELTSALLNTHPEDPVLQNLPFARGSATKLFDIGLDELRERRLSLIACVLGNIRTQHDKRNPQNERQVAVTIVTQLMDSMKKYFQELGSASTSRSAYVDFVQKVVQFLQQYTADICPVDKFFVEDGPFPLPVDDPLYVVGRLRAYHLKAQDLAAQKKLVMFVQTVCERAAAEHQHVYLASQVVKSVDGLVERACDTAPSLRQLLLNALLPIYIRAVGTSDVAWFIARPALAACVELLDKLLCGINLQDTVMLLSARNMATAILCAVDDALYKPTGQISIPTKRKQAFVTARLMIIGASALSILDVVARNNIEIRTAKEIITKLHALAVAIRTGQVGSDTPIRTDENRHGRAELGTLTEMRAFAERELASALSKVSWRTEDEYSIWRHGRREAVATGLGSWEEEHAALEQAADGFVRALRRMPAFRDVCDGHDGCRALDRSWGCNVFV